MEKLNKLTQLYKKKGFGANQTPMDFERFMKQQKYAQKAKEALGLMTMAAVVPHVLSGNTIVFFDLETTGFKAEEGAEILQFSAAKYVDKVCVDKLSFYVKPHADFEVNFDGSITAETVADANHIEVELPRIKEFIEGAILVAHNMEFDYNFLNHYWIQHFGGGLAAPLFCTLVEARFTISQSADHKLGTLVEFFDIDVEGDFHNADVDVDALAQVFFKMYTAEVYYGFDKYEEDEEELE